MKANAFQTSRANQSYFLGGSIMPERIVPGPVSGLKDNCEAVCIHTKKVYDSCREQDMALYKYVGYIKSVGF